MKIVVVEDEVRIREGITKLINKVFQNYEVVGSAENGKEGYDLIMAKKPDLIITDVKMPYMDGLEMISKLYQNKVKCKAIILSAYAEFTYAQQAIRWGVSEYLIKPLDVGELVQAIKNIEKVQEEDEKRNPDMLGKLDNIIFGLIFGSMQIDDKLIGFLEDKYGFFSNRSLIEIQIYLGKQYQMQIGKKRKEIEASLKNKGGIHYCLLEIPKEKMLLGIIYQYNDQKEIERWFQQEIFLRSSNKGDINCSYGWIVADGLKDLKSSYYLLSQHMDWNISFGDAVMISYPKILRVQTSVCIYPIAIENQLKVAICSYDFPKTINLVEHFKEYFQNGSIYPPREIKESYVRFLWAVINVAKEIGAIRYEDVEQQKLLNKIMESINREELWAVADEVVGLITISKEADENVNQLSYHVKRAENMIMEYYQSGITLDEIASKLNITPEYLGMQFHKEKEIKFSTYMKDFRITKAKELLIGSQMKVFEIAEQVGYSDAKYFSRVFKEYTGQLPAEYRKAYK